MPDPLVDEKRALRAEIRQRRRSHGELEAARLGPSFAETLRTLVLSANATCIACYLSSLVEPNTRDFLAWAYGAGIRVLLPVTREDGLLDWVAHDGKSERMHELGFPEAVGEPLGPAAVADVDILIIPAAAVDRRGMRLGWGKGFYDRTLAHIEAGGSSGKTSQADGPLASSPPVFAVVYDAEVFDEVPSESHDKRVDGAITQSGVIRFA